MKNKECSFCEEYKVLVEREDDNDFGVSLQYPNNLLVWGYDRQGWDISLKTKINYCPLCGRKLEDD